MLSSRGPGVIGMLIALVVLLGFVILATFAFDQGMQGADQSIESIIAKQLVEIESMQGMISQGEKSLAKTGSLEAIARQLTAAKRKIELGKDRSAKLTQNITAEEDSIAQITKNLTQYTADYRASARSRAKNRAMDQLITLKGKVYEKVIIRDVTDAGVDIRHDGGSARIPPAELPTSMAEEFLIDPKKNPANHQNQGDPGEDSGMSASERLLDEKNKKNQSVAREQRIRDIGAKEARIDKLRGEIDSLEKMLLKGQYKGLIKAPQMRLQVVADKTELDRLINEVLLLRENL